MAYPYNYNPYAYAPYQMPQYQVTQPQPPMQAQGAAFASQTPASIIWINGEKEAALYPVAPNAAVTLWDSTAPCVYLKKADASGKPTMTTYDLVERSESLQATKTGTDVKTDAFATKKELSDVLDLVRMCREDIDRMISDAHGPTNKRGTTRKEDDRE